MDNNSSLNKSFQSNSSKKRSNTNLKPYELMVIKDKKNEFYLFLDEIIKKYLKKNSYINELNEKDQYIITKFNSFFNEENNFEKDKDELLNDFLSYIQDLVNDDKTHIEIIEKSGKKLKLLTVQYLKEKYNKLMILYQIAEKSKINGTNFFEYFPGLLNEFFKIFEKLIIGMGICKQENILFEKSEKNGGENNYLENLFLDNFYEKLKEKIGIKEDINHLDLFGKVDNINEELLEIFFESFFYVSKIDMNDKMKNLNNYFEQKDNLMIFISNVILEINKDIEKLLFELNPENRKNEFIKYNNGLWFLSSNNYITNKYLLQIFKDIAKWKLQTYKESKIDNDTIFLYAEQLHFLFKNYLLIGNNSFKDKSDFMNTIKTIDEILGVFDVDRTYQICKKYLDDFTLAKIAFNNKEKYYSDLKIFMKKELEKKKGHIKYILQLILGFEIQNINKCKDDNNIIFNYFEEFSSFEKEIGDIVKTNKKSEYFFDLYLLQKNVLNNINDENSMEKIISYMKKENKEKEIDDVDNKRKIDYLIKLLCLNKSVKLIKDSYLNNKDEEMLDNNNRMIIDQDEEELIHA